MIGEDTDLLLLLLFYSAKNDSSFKLRFRSDRENKKQAKTVYDIHRYRDILGHDRCSVLLFIHAFTGCDTTSQFCGIGKGTSFKTLIDHKDVPKLAKIFSTVVSTCQDIEEAGEATSLILYNGKEGESIN